MLFCSRVQSRGIIRRIVVRCIAGGIDGRLWVADLLHSELDETVTGYLQCQTGNFAIADGRLTAFGIEKRFNTLQELEHPSKYAFLFARTKSGNHSENSFSLHSGWHRWKHLFEYTFIVYSAGIL